MSEKGRERIGTDKNGEKTVTNGDRIRAMSNEELAEEFDAYDWGCPPDSDKWPCKHPKCRQCWLNWLNAEAKEEE